MNGYFGGRGHRLIDRLQFPVFQHDNQVRVSQPRTSFKTRFALRCSHRGDDFVAGHSHGEAFGRSRRRLRSHHRRGRGSLLCRHGLWRRRRRRQDPGRIGLCAHRREPFRNEPGHNPAQHIILIRIRERLRGKIESQCRPHPARTLGIIDLTRRKKRDGDVVLNNRNLGDRRGGAEGGRPRPGP